MSVEEDTELRDLVAQTLETNGVLNKIRAELRANVFLALEEHTVKQAKVTNTELKSFLETKEGHQAFSLVREFLQHFDLDFTLAVLDPEASYSGKSASRKNLENELNLGNCDSKKPLLMEFLKTKGDAALSSSTSSSKKSGSKIPQLLKTTPDVNKNKEQDVAGKRNMLSLDYLDNEDDLLKELGVSPISEAKKNTKPSWLDQSDSSLKKSPKNSPKKGPLNLDSLQDAPPLPGVTKKDFDSDINSPEWDDLMKIDKKISDMGFEIPKEEKGFLENTKDKDSRYSYADDFFNGTSSERSDKLSVTEEIEGDLSIGSFAGSKVDELFTTDQTVSQISGTGFDYGEEVEF